MPPRRILFVLLLLMIAMSAAAAISGQENDSTSTTPAAEPPRGEVARTVTATLPGDRVVRARIGDQVKLTVAVDERDTVEIVGFDLFAAADETTPALFDFVAYREGRFEVRVEMADRTVGRLEVTDRP